MNTDALTLAVFQELFRGYYDKPIDDVIAATKLAMKELFPPVKNELDDVPF